MVDTHGYSMNFNIHFTFKTKVKIYFQTFSSRVFDKRNRLIKQVSIGISHVFFFSGNSSHRVGLSYTSTVQPVQANISGRPLSAAPYCSFHGNQHFFSIDYFCGYFTRIKRGHLSWVLTHNSSQFTV